MTKNELKTAIIDLLKTDPEFCLELFMAQGTVEMQAIQGSYGRFMDTTKDRWVNAREQQLNEWEIGPGLRPHIPDA